MNVAVLGWHIHSWHLVLHIGLIISTLVRIIMALHLQVFGQNQLEISRGETIRAGTGVAKITGKLICPARYKLGGTAAD